MSEGAGQIVLEMPPTEATPRNSEGAFLDLDGGRLMFAWSRFTGGLHDHSEATITARYSDDGGRTWGETERTLVGNEGSMNVMSVSLLPLDGKRAALFYIVKNGLTDARYRLRTTEDGGENWSDPVPVIRAPGYFVVNNDRVVRLSSGRLIVPAAFHRSKGEDPESYDSFDSRGIAMFFLSDDQGVTWREAKQWVATGLPGCSSGLQEPGVVELKDGRLFAWARTDLGCQYGMHSADGGETWTPPVPTRFRSPCSPLSMKRIPATGDLLAVWNDHSGRFPVPAEHPETWARSPLVTAISRDDGQTWEHHQAIEDDPNRGFCYTAIHFPDPDHVLLAYCAGGVASGLTLNTLRMRRLALSELYG